MAGIICDKCSKEVRSEQRGSLTQWIFDESSCSCSRSVLVQDSAAKTDKSRICPKCFNFKTSRRSGSITQWIFRRYQCNCESQTDKVPADDIGKTGKPQRLFEPSSNREPASEEDFVSSELPFAIERYKPLRYISRSTASVVYKCFDRQLGRLVAIKTLSFSDSAALIRFQQEARATAHLKHPNIVEVLDFGIGSGGSAYMVLEFIKANNLEDLIETQGPLSEKETLEMIEGVCRALNFAHKKAIYHRDLKPQNILISENRQPKLIDFGLALILSPVLNNRDTHGLSLAGTPSYMSPDQFLGRSYDARSEIYSLGCVLFACLTGRAPFTADTPLELANQHAKSEIPTLRQFSPTGQFSDRIEQVIHRCLDKDPDSRYSSISELAHDMEIEMAGSNQDTEENTEENAEEHRNLTNKERSMSDATSKPESKIVDGTTEDTTNKFISWVIGGLVILVVTTIAVFTPPSVPSLEKSPKDVNAVTTTDDRISVLSVSTPNTDTRATTSGDQVLSTWEDKMDSNIQKYLHTDNRTKSEYGSMLSEGDKVRRSKNATEAELNAALHSYAECIKSVKSKGPVAAPDRTITRALVGMYNVNLRLKRFDKLADLEKEIITYCPTNDNLPETAYNDFQQVANIRMKQKKPREAIRSLKSALQIWTMMHKNEGLQNRRLKRQIGKTYFFIDDWQKAKVWFEQSIRNGEKKPANREFDLPTLIRLAVCEQNLKDYKKSNQRFQEAEKLGLKNRVFVNCCVLAFD